QNEVLSTAEKLNLTQLAQQRLAAGFRDNTWFLQTKGTDYQLVPPAVAPVSVVRTAYIEADGVPLPEPDPADATRVTHAWMTVHRYEADHRVGSPFADWKTLQAE
ncbi:MAG: transglutaminase domain-containing protein, partial [Planctomycetaceae bacterium]|nr:transglutaminase domain-containing protein [Planctomycetaceae bacterium]